MRRVLILIGLLVIAVSCAKESLANKDDIASVLAKRFKIGADNISISDIHISGLYEVTLATGEVFYTDKTGNNIIIGRLIDKDNVDLTAKKEAELDSKMIAKLEAELDLTKAIKVGNGKVKVIEFTDVDCPFCFKAEGFFAGRDVTRYIFLNPLDELHPDAAKKSVHILCSDNSSEEYFKVINNQVTEFRVCNQGNDLLKTHRDYGVKAGVQGTPHFIVNSKKIIGADPKIINEIEGK